MNTKFVTAALILLLFAVVFFLPDTRPVTTNTVWSYWHSPLPPAVVRRCRANWTRVGKVQDVRFLNAFTVHKWVPLSTLAYFSRITSCQAHKSDLIRFYLLKHYGGTWIDASVFFTAPLDWLPEQGVFCYKADRFSVQGLTCLENFMIKAPKGHPFIERWMDQTINEFLDKNYKENNKKFRDIIGKNGDYLVPYVASMKLTLPGDLVTKSAEEGPYRDTVRVGWDNADELCKSIEYAKTKIVKLWNKPRSVCSPNVVPLHPVFKDHSPAGVYDRFKTKFDEYGNGETGPTDMVYAIAMPDRLAYIKGKLSELGTKYKLFNAIKPDDLTKEDYERMSETFNPKNKMLHKRMTKLPVCLSFFMCYYDAYVNGYDTILVLEDDIKFNVSIDRIKQAIEEFKKIDAEVLFLGYCWANCDKNYTQVTENLHRAPREVQLLCNHALVMKNSFIRTYMERDHPTFWNNRNDHTLSNFLRDHDVFKCVPPKAFINQNRAEMGSNNENYDLGGKACNLEKKN